MEVLVTEEQGYTLALSLTRPLTLTLTLPSPSPLPLTRYTLALSRSSKTGYRGVYAKPTNVSRPFTASVKPRGERRKSLGSYATAVEAALARAKAVAQYDAENPQPA